VPLSTFNRALARILYEEERFHLLGHADADSDYLSPSNPTDTAGASALTDGQKATDAAISETASEEGAVLLKNDGGALPLSRNDLKNLLVLGSPAEYMPANPGPERANGYLDRAAISPLEQLKQFAPADSKITYLPYRPGSPPVIGDGVAVPKSALSTDGTTIGNGLQRTAGPGSPTIDAQVDFTKVSGHGQLEPGGAYTWIGYVNVPAADDYTFRFQFSVPNLSSSQPACTGSGAPTFQFASSAGTGQSMSTKTLSSSGNTPAFSGSFGTPIHTNPTVSGYTERGLANCQWEAGNVSQGVHRIQISWTAPASLGSDAYNLREPGSTAPSLRFAYSRQNGDLADVKAAAASASKVIVFAECGCPNEAGGPSANVAFLDANTNTLVQAAAAANPNTVVVLNATQPVLMPWFDGVKAVLEMWYPGEEGGTSTARLLLGLANPGGHTVMTWPAKDSDTIFGYNETAPLYPGDTTGVHNERLVLSGSPPSPPPTRETEGLFVGYRFFDKEGITPLVPFGFGLSYTTFKFSNLSVKPSGDGVDVSFVVANTGKRRGADVAQVYVGPAPSVPAGVQQVKRSLRGFVRVELKPGQAVKRTIHIGPGSNVDGYGDRRAFQYWSSPGQKWVTATGCRTIQVGDADTPSLLTLSGTGGPGC
jgi:beta-glucosidase